MLPAIRKTMKISQQRKDKGKQDIDHDVFEIPQDKT